MSNIAYFTRIPKFYFSDRQAKKWYPISNFCLDMENPVRLSVSPVISVVTITVHRLSSGRPFRNKSKERETKTNPGRVRNLIPMQITLSELEQWGTRTVESEIWMKAMELIR
jgi:hypothetical protein